MGNKKQTFYVQKLEIGVLRNVTAVRAESKEEAYEKYCRGEGEERGRVIGSTMMCDDLGGPIVSTADEFTRLCAKKSHVIAG